MPLSWNEIRSRAHTFAREWSSSERLCRVNEKAEAQTFWNEFFEVFGKKRKHLAAFEEPVKKLSGDWGYIDLFWPGTMIAEHKSPGKDLGKAHAQAMNYVRGLIDADRDRESPRWLIISDFTRIALHDLQPEQDPDFPLFKRIPPTLEFPLKDLPKMVHAFGFIAGYRTYRVKEEDPANIEAAELLADFHDVLEAGGYPKENIDRFLVRILFCLFAEDTGIFDSPNTFTDYIRNRTAEDGSDLGVRLEQLFRVLDTPKNKRQYELDEDLADLPHVNGLLFQERLEFANFNYDMRTKLLACARFNWSLISPAIFGSLFQSVMEPKERRQIGAHYTSERDILKLIHALFLDDLKAEFDQIKTDRSTRRSARLVEFQGKLASIKILDPACGCGNFLILAYRELRRLEILSLLELHAVTIGKDGGTERQQQTELTLEEINRLAQVDVNQLYGIEIGEWPARIAEVAVWLMDHLMNQELSAAFDQLYRRLPLKKSATIISKNALHLDWNDVLSSKDCTYVLGNPPFVGKKEQSKEQKADMALVWGEEKGSGVLDYVTTWYLKAANYIHNTKIRVAFVSTNSISQGEQVGILWRGLRKRYTLYIHFAHRSFAWMSEARGKAHVHVVIIGFAAFDHSNKIIYDYAHSKAEPSKIAATRINPYLADAVDVLLFKRGKPICNVPNINYGSMANDKRKDDKGLGNLILNAESRKKILDETPELTPYIRPFVGSEEFLNGTQRWCLWLINVSPQLLRKSTIVCNRMNAIREARLASGRPETVKLAATPSLFGEIRQPNSSYLLIPKVSSEDRPYMPLGFFSSEVIANGSSLIIPDAGMYEFGILSSMIHMAWMRYTGGRLESRYQYSSQIVYNNFPWPNIKPKQRLQIEEKAQAVIDAREPHLFPKGMNTIADLYDPLAMPKSLAKAHADLDHIVEKSYRNDLFHSDRERVEYLFRIYEQITTPLLPVTSRTRNKCS